MINEKHKDRLFSYMFGNEKHKEWTLSIYNAVNGSNYTDPGEIELNTIQNVLYMGMKNDVSFIIHGDMNLYGHQSTYNPNMPIRELMYTALLYDKYISGTNANIYGTKLIELPIPKLVVFYNGTDKTEDEVILELKDSFPADKDADSSDIQARVRMLNINYGNNKTLLDACAPLMEYSWLIDKIRFHKSKDISIEDAVDQALDEMPDYFSIKSFLMDHKAEVRMMCITEYNEAETMQRFKEEGREEGRAEGRALILETLVKDGTISAEKAKELESQA